MFDNKISESNAFHGIVKVYIILLYHYLVLKLDLRA